MSKKIRGIALLAAASMALSIFGAGCSSKTEQKSAAASGTEVKKEEPKKEEVKYPTKPIQLIIPVTPGGDTDVNGRVFAKYLEKELKQPVALVNVSGASGVIGAKKVKDAAPDGYTALFFHGELMIPQLMGLADFTYSDFEIPAVVAEDQTTILAVNSKSKINSMQDLMDEAKKNPGKIEFGSAYGGYPHLIGLALEDAAKIDLNVTDVGGNAEKTVALKGQKTDVINTQYGLTKDYFKSGEFRALAVLSEKRNPLIPDIKTAKEQGVDMVFGKTFFFALPKGTPKDVVEKFSKACENVTKNPEWIKEAESAFLTPTYMPQDKAEGYLKSVKDTFAKYSELMKAATKKK